MSRVCTFDARTILVVEDDDDYREVIRDALAEEGYRVTACASGREAIEYLEGTGHAPDAPAVDAIVLDALLPEVSGAELCRWLIGEPRHATIPVVLVTGLPRDRVADLKSLPNVRAFLMKPFALSDLVAALARSREPAA